MCFVARCVLFSSLVVVSCVFVVGCSLGVVCCLFVVVIACCLGLVVHCLLFIASVYGAVCCLYVVVRWLFIVVFCYAYVVGSLLLDISLTRCSSYVFVV